MNLAQFLLEFPVIFFQVLPPWTAFYFGAYCGAVGGLWTRLH